MISMWWTGIISTHNQSSGLPTTTVAGLCVIVKHPTTLEILLLSIHFTQAIMASMLAGFSIAAILLQTETNLFFTCPPREALPTHTPCGSILLFSASGLVAQRFKHRIRPLNSQESNTRCPIRDYDTCRQHGTVRELLSQYANYESA